MLHINAFRLILGGGAVAHTSNNSQKLGTTQMFRVVVYSDVVNYINFTTRGKALSSTTINIHFICICLCLFLLYVCRVCSRKGTTTLSPRFFCKSFSLL